MKLGKKPEYGVVVEGGIPARFFDFFWAYHQMHFMSESALIRDNWMEKWNRLSDKEKEEIKKYLDRNPSPRMEQANKMKCE